MTEAKKIKLSEIILHEIIHFTNPNDNCILLGSLIHSITSLELVEIEMQKAVLREEIKERGIMLCWCKIFLWILFRKVFIFRLMSYNSW